MKETQIFIQDKFEDYDPGRASQRVLRTVPPFRSQGTVIYEVYTEVYTKVYTKWCISDSLHNLDLNGIIIVM